MRAGWGGVAAALALLLALGVHAEEPGHSFVRYLDPDTDEIVTCKEEAWNMRLFRVRGDRPFWHAVWSDTHRFSIGYRILPGTARPRPSLLRRVARKLVPQP